MIKKIDRPLARLIKKKRENNPMGNEQTKKIKHETMLNLNSNEKGAN